MPFGTRIDSDTYGNSAVTLDAVYTTGRICSRQYTDCNDNDDNIGGSITYYEDADNDTYGNSASTIRKRVHHLLVMY